MGNERNLNEATKGFRKMKALIIAALALTISACGGGSSSESVELDAPTIEASKTYIVAGQSNAALCDWSYFELEANAKVVNIAVSGASIERLHHDYLSSSVSNSNPSAIIFVHGETDAIDKTNADEYVVSVESYRAKISADTGVELPLVISSVGYQVGGVDSDFDIIRNAVYNESYENELWSIGYSDTKYFIEWGLLFDDIHYNQQGCEMMMNGLISAL